MLSKAISPAHCPVLPSSLPLRPLLPAFASRKVPDAKKNKLLILLIIVIDCKEEMRKISSVSSQVPVLFEGCRVSSYSVSTEESPREHPLAPSSYKEKSQLCKKFVENGYCPYEKRCKFAHGLHELKKNHQANCKYKTKTCGGFLQEGFCPYGNRCNFIHPPSLPQARVRQLDPEMAAIKMSAEGKSRLLLLLWPQTASY